MIKGSICSQIPEHIIDQSFLHIGGICIIVIQDQFIQAIAGLAFHIMVKFQLEAVTIRGRIAGNGRQTGVSLWTDPYLVKSLSVDFHITGIIFLLYGIFQHLFPLILIHEDIYLHRFIRIKKCGLILHGNAVFSGQYVYLF